MPRAEDMSDKGRVILVPVDLSPASEAAFQWALTNVLRPSDHLHIFYAMNAPIEPGRQGVPNADYFEQASASDATAQAEDRLNQVYVSKLLSLDLDIRPVVHIVQVKAVAPALQCEIHPVPKPT